MTRYVDRICADICNCRNLAAEHGAVVPDQVDSIYLGGGTPSLLPREQLQRLFQALGSEFQIAPDAEITVECAPGTLTQPVLESFAQCGVNRVSLGVQSFIDKEAASVGRLHTRARVFADIADLRAHGISNINVDLIAGLPHQTLWSWNESLDHAIATGVPHVSVYMLDVDLDSRLGFELLAGGTKYHAQSVPDADIIATMYETARERLAQGDIAQYEISNFAREGFESRHNLKYWTRQPYLGFGLDAHSMLPGNGTAESVRMATTDEYDDFFVSSGIEAFPVSRSQALEENFFLGLRLNRGLSLDSTRETFGCDLEKHKAAIEELLAGAVLTLDGDMLRLTDRGRMVSNEVFERFILEHDSSVVIA